VATDGSRAGQPDIFTCRVIPPLGVTILLPAVLSATSTGLRTTVRKSSASSTLAVMMWGGGWATVANITNTISCQLYGIGQGAAGTNAQVYKSRITTLSEHIVCGGIMPFTGLAAGTYVVEMWADVNGTTANLNLDANDELGIVVWEVEA